jgi:hypothetical protein
MGGYGDNKLHYTAAAPSNRAVARGRGQVQFLGVFDDMGTTATYLSEVL